MKMRCWFIATIAAICCGTTTRADDDEVLRKLIGSALEKSRRDYTVMPLDSLTNFAVEGIPEAQWALGFRYFDPSGGIFDTDKGLEWIHKAADQGAPYAQAFLAGAFYQGKIVAQNIDSSMYWTDKAAVQDWGLSQMQKSTYALAMAKDSTDSVNAYMWSNLATYNVYTDRDILMGDSLKSYIARFLSPAQVAQGDSLTKAYLINRLRETTKSDSVRYIKQLSKIGWPEGIFREGKMYFHKYATDSSQRVGCDLFAKAANAGYGPAAFEIGDKYNWGLKPVTHNLDSAVYWLSMGVALADADAQLSLGYMYSVGRGVKKDPREAVRLLKLSAAQNSKRGIRELGYFYWSDNVPKKNKVRAWALMTIAKSRFLDVDIVKIGEIIQKMNDKERAEAEQLRKDLSDETKIKGIIDGWVD